MLKSLTIKNYALIDSLTVDFGSGLSILTGETGAGKSIIIGALSLLLGERAKSDVIRQGEEIAIIEGLFQLPFSLESIQDSDNILHSDDGLLLRREIHLSGRNRIFANDSPVSMAFLTQIGDLLVDLHGQHAHQTLLKIDQHLAYLDNFGVDLKIRMQVKKQYQNYQSLNKKLSEWTKRKKTLLEKQELLSFQVKEIEQADIQLNEETSLEQEEKILQNSEKIISVMQKLNYWLYEGEGAVTEKLSGSEAALRDLMQVDQSLEQRLRQCESARILVDEIVGGLQSYTSKIEFNPEHLEEIRERLALLSTLKKKYGGSIEKILAFWEQGKEELDQIESLDETVDALQEEVCTVKAQLSDLSQQLTDLRKEAAIKLEKESVSALNELGLQKAVFKIIINQMEQDDGPLKIQGKRYKASSLGIDHSEFYLSLNPGEDPKPLAMIASGGEISRIMLALKSVLAEADNVPVLIFDEIDTGISGRIARVVGKYLKILSQNHQVICITHLPQIASMGDKHYCVEKKLKDNRTFTTIRDLDEESRIQEIAKLLGGDTITDTTVQGARELLNLKE